MELDLIRYKITDKSILGKLALNGVYECFTLERPYNDPKFKPIPEGKYPVNIRWSNHFGQLMPHIDNVPDREAIEIHWGNTPNDSEGCVLVGAESGIDEVLDSRAAFAVLFSKLQKLDEQIYITIKGATNETST